MDETVMLTMPSSSIDAASPEFDPLTSALAVDVDANFEQMVLTYQDRLYRFALRLTDNPQDAEEIAQDAFVRAYKALCSYTAERRQTLALRAWLYQITLNVFRNRHRSQPPEAASFEADDIDIADSSTPPPDQQAERGERYDELARVVAAMPRHFREVVVMHYIEELTFVEIATALNQPVGTVKANVSRGIDLLRKKMKG